MAEARRVSFRDGRFASRKTEEAAWRRHQAAAWLESMVGPFGLTHCPSEQEFVAALRNGIVLCKAINKIQPGVVPKVVANAPCDSQPSTAFQYFENIRNFLVAVQALKLPSFEASDLEKDNLDAGSVGKIVDCVNSLKSYQERKKCSGTYGPVKYMKSPLAPRSAIHVQSENVTLGSSTPQKCLDLTEIDAEGQSSQNVGPNMEEAIGKLQRIILDCMISCKENLNQDVLKKDPVTLVGTILSNQLEKEQFKPLLQLISPEGAATKNEPNQHIECSNSQNENRLRLLEAQESELLELKTMFQEVKVDFRSLQTQFQDDITELGHNIQGISKAALGYNQAVKENRNLYNMLQEVRGNIRVFCRIRPLMNSKSISSIEHVGNDGSIMVCDPYKPQTTRKIFQFNQIFGPTTTQDEIYRETQSLIRSVMDGYNVCILAYGQTGSGKTHTMCGPSGGLSSNDLGINYMALNDLFTISTSREDVKYDIRVQMVEIYNEQVRDLLSEDTSSTKLDIRSSSNGLFNLPDAKMCPVQSPSDVMTLMLLGEKHRASGPTAMNNRSSRSHSILTVHVNGKDISGNVSCSCLHLVDLAGSERVDRSEATGDRLKEAQHINKSLSCLGDVITALAQKNSHIPYRNSKLTQLLQSSLGGNAKTLMLAHISPEGESYVETLSTLKFAQRASTVELGTAHANKESNDIRELKEQVETLKKALATKEFERSSLKLKENTVTSERTKQLPQRTPPRPRRLSLETTSSEKGSIPGKPPKSPVSAMTFNRDHGTARDKECRIDGFNRTKIHGSVIQMSPTLSEEPVGHENEKIVTTDDMVTSYQLPPDGYNQYKQSGLDTLQRTPCRSRYMGVQVSQTEEPSDAKLDKTTTSSVAKRGSHLRRSIQSSIGKLIHGSERRNTPHSAQATPAKITTNANNDGASPITTNARLRRRQSLTGLPPPSTTMSRRSSLGGKSDSSSSDRKAKTPPLMNSAAKAKRWL
ncbi:kinesin-like protein KIN-14A isoform X2 [Triticum aestivum]|uniref:Kinesin motor domain-containing protein n=1 Tax=Triticum aestivum TaxID=4565 RepID=A0A3B6GQX8_WHEAT|nr:kinesin-like protein KIN-14A isoform X2 [Triticum aestivum]